MIILTISLLSLSTSRSRLDQSHLDLLTAQYTAKSALSATTIALHKNSDVVEVQGNGAYWDSIIVRLKGGSWKQLSNDFQEISSPNALKVFANRGQKLQARPRMEFKVTITQQGAHSFLGKVSTMAGRKLYNTEGHISVATK
jgi:hypothetical protein